MEYMRPIDAVAYRKKLEEEIDYVKEHPEHYLYSAEVIAGLDAAIAELGDMPNVEPDDSFWVVYRFGPDDESKIVSRVYSIDKKDNMFLIIDGWNKFRWADIQRCELFEGWENYEEESA